MAYGRKKLRLPPFVPLTWELLNSQAYIDLPASAAKALPYFLGKVKLALNDPQRHKTEFSFSYGEAEQLGFARGTHSRSITELMDKGFINPVDKGGLRGCGRSCSLFILSDRWKRYGTPEFEQIAPWNQFAPVFKKTNSSAKMEHYKGKNGTKKAQDSVECSENGLVEAF